MAADCAVPGARQWQLVEFWPSESVRAELRELTGALAAELGRALNRMLGRIHTSVEQQRAVQERR